MTSLYLDPHAVISAWEEMGSDSWCDLDASSGATSIALDLSGVEAALKAGSPGTSSPTSWAGEAAAGGAGGELFGPGSPTSWKAAVAAGGGGGVTADRGSAGGAGGLALVPDCPPSDTHTPQVTHPVTAATAAAGSYNTGTPLTWGLRPLSANLLSGPPQQALLLQPLPQGRISSSSSGGAAEGSPGAAAGGAGSGVMFSTGGFHIAAAAAGGVGTQGRPLLLRQVSGPSPPPASAAGTATVVKAGGQLYLLHQQLQAAPAPVKIGTGGQTTGPTASRSSSFEMAVVPDHGQRQGPSCSGQSDSSSPQGGVGGSSHGSGAGWRGHSSSDGADNSPTSATAAAAAAAAGSMAMGRPSCSPAPSSPVSPRGVTHAVTRRPGLVTRRLAAAAAAAALGGSGSAPGFPTGGSAPLGPPTSNTSFAAPAAASVTSTPAGHLAGAAGMRELYAQARAECLARYRAKKARRKFTNTVRYHARKVNADKRPRIKGRFVRKEELAAMGWEDLEGGSGDADVDLEMYSQQQQEEAVCYSSYSSRAAVNVPPPAGAAAAAAAAAVVPVAAPVAAPPPAAAAAPAAAVPPMAGAQQVQEEDLVGDLLFQDMDMADLDLLDDMTPGLVSDLLYYC